MATHEQRVDRCILHGLKSIGLGLAVGLIASTLIFKRKRWAFLLSAGYGIGSAVAGCDHELFHREYLDPCEEERKMRKNKKKGQEDSPKPSA
ncbi:UPF0327 protein C1orf151-like [Nesidiocoris tenuis]|uniref:MICOS complex subunit MIC10 n=1 Tax=Nesidiocoris tenuis TaxID=355587 RepID=A0ABN7AAY4_9HEMI|nr:UPF0327 protein C1orf151-like [Nesidiocoris tenuis]